MYGKGELFQLSFKLQLLLRNVSITFLCMLSPVGNKMQCTAKFFTIGGTNETLLS